MALMSSQPSSKASGLDWWRSGVFNAFGLVRRVLHAMRAFVTTATRSQPPCRGAPLSMAMEYCSVLEVCSSGFRFTLTFTIILIPQSLAIHGFRGPIRIGTRKSSGVLIPLCRVALIGGLLLRKRSGILGLVFAAGLAMAQALRGCFFCAQYSSGVGAPENYYRAPSC